MTGWEKHSAQPHTDIIEVDGLNVLLEVFLGKFEAVFHIVNQENPAGSPNVR